MVGQRSPKPLMWVRFLHPPQSTLFIERPRYPRNDRKLKTGVIAGF